MALSVYVVIVALVAAERVFELWLSSRNARRVRNRGGIERGQRHYGFMVVLHTAFLASCLIEAVVMKRQAPLWLALLALTALLLSMALRYWAIATLGDRWNTRVLVEPGVAAVRGGPYRLARHPNYVAVVVEIAALPLVQGAWWTAIFFSLSNLGLLAVRIQVEERALEEYCNYDRVFEREPVE